MATEEARGFWEVDAIESAEPAGDDDADQLTCATVLPHHGR